MDDRGRYLDNIFIECLWRSMKYEAVYLHELADGRDAERVIGSWFAFYNDVRPHSSLGGHTPAEVYGGVRGRAAAFPALPKAQPPPLDDAVDIVRTRVGMVRSSRASNHSEW